MKVKDESALRHTVENELGGISLTFLQQSSKNKIFTFLF